MKHLILAGAGHAHAQVLRQLVQARASSAQDKVNVTMVSPYRLAPYSGMVPGWLSGRYTFDQIAIDFQRLCHAAGVTWIEAAVDWLNPDERMIGLADGTRLAYDRLSLNIGSTLEPPDPEMLTLRPLANLQRRFEELVTSWTNHPARAPRLLTVVGGGAAGFEVLLALKARLAAIADTNTDDDKGHCESLKARIVTRAPSILPGQSWLTRQLASRALQKHSVQCLTQTEWSPSMQSDKELVIWATGAVAHAWLRDPARRGSLAVNPDGYIRIDSYLRSVSHPDIYAAGDCAHFEDPTVRSDGSTSPATRASGLPKAGVYAVRMGPALSHNLLGGFNQTGQAHGRTNRSAPIALRKYSPQEQFLTLLNTSDGSAIAARGSLAAQGQWAMCWKDRIDTAFVNQFFTG